MEVKKLGSDLWRTPYSMYVLRLLSMFERRGMAWHGMVRHWHWRGMCCGKIIK